MKILVSACLMGRNCKYSGGNNLSQKLLDFVEGHQVFEVCPEVLGGLPTPRVPAEIVDGVVLNAEGLSVDEQYHRGAELALKVALDNQVDLAVLQSRSPSCGVGVVYDGTFSKHLVDGNGVFAELLIRNGIRVIDVKDL